MPPTTTGKKLNKPKLAPRATAAPAAKADGAGGASGSGILSGKKGGGRLAAS